jgi:NADH-quinone oxidoreductase subunit I
MGSVKEYFSSLGSGIASLVKGMQVTGKEFVTPKITEFYPEDRETFQWPERFRATLQFIYDEEGNHKCIACGMCQRSCPNGTITVETRMVDTWDGKKKKKLDKYLYDLGSCTFCQMCVSNCPTHAIKFNNDFEQAVFTREKLVKQLNYLPEKEEPAPTPEQIAAANAERERKIAEAKAKAAAAKASGGEGTAPEAPKTKPDINSPEMQAKIAAAKAKAAAMKAAREGKAPESGN